MGKTARRHIITSGSACRSALAPFLRKEVSPQAAPLPEEGLPSALSGSSIPVGQTKGRPFYRQAKEALINS